MDVPIIAAAIAGTGLAITVIVLLVRGGFLLGRLVKQVDTHEAKIDALDAKFDAKFDALDAKIDALTAAVQQTNAILVGLANHTHDADGRVALQFRWFSFPAGYPSG